uniref:B30.2/SPRY domain-containing protein n=1 Tax=Globodera pallida TaxID=36090 RepID=A0A183CFK5_GLOPA
PHLLSPKNNRPTPNSLRAHHPNFAFSEPVQPSDSKLFKSKKQPSGSKLYKSKKQPSDSTPSEPVQPSDSKPSDSKRLLVVKYKPGDWKQSNVFAVQPIPKTGAGTFYYEVTILGKAIHSFIAIGLCAKQMPLNAELGDKNSYAYQSCGLFAAHSVPMLVDSNGIKIPMFRAGNVVGCGVNLKNNELFYTLNGKRLGTAARFNSTDELYPCVTLSKSGDEIKANFGPDFVKKDLLPKD